MIGDSHSQILFPMLAEKLQSQGHQIVYQQSMAGWGVKRYLGESSMLSALSESNPNVVIVSLGGNNQKTDNRYKDEVDNFLSRLGRKTIYWIAPFYSTRADVQARHEWTDKWLKWNLPKQTRYIQTMHISQDKHRDGVHFTRAKYQDIADYIYGQIKSSIGIPSVLYRNRRRLMATTLLFGLGLYIYRNKSWLHLTKRLKSTSR